MDKRALRESNTLHCRNSKGDGGNGEDIESLRIAALLHDIGKIGTYEAILDKPGSLTEEEFELIKMHPVRGAEILRPLEQLKDILPIIRHHHERIDGKGYNKSASLNPSV